MADIEDLAEMPLAGPEATIDEWLVHGSALNKLNLRLGWEIGDWWNRGEKWGERSRIVLSPEWTGPSYQTCRNNAVVAAKFPEEHRRRGILEFHHFEAVAMLPLSKALAQLEAFETEIREGRSITRQHARQVGKRERRDERERELGDRIAAAPADLAGGRRYGVILADPPWRFEPYSRDTGLDRAADNHYPTMSTEQICAIDVPATNHAVLFLWRTAPMQEAAVEIMKAWNFRCVSELIWDKITPGTGYWLRSRHEVLMIGARGEVPAPAPGTQPQSLYQERATAHSVKPELFYELIEAMFPTVPKLEMFARRARPGWTAWGIETP